MELETAVERLYTDESLAADVDDKTAAPLLKWAESVLPVLVMRGDEGFDEAFVTLKKLIKSVARLIDMRGEMDPTERAERAEKIQGFAQELGIIVNVDQLESLASFEGPELVAQMVGPVAAFSVPTPTPAIEAQAANAETPKDEHFSAAPDEKQVEAASSSGTYTEPRAADSAGSDNVVTEVAPDEKVKAWFVDKDTANTDKSVPPTEQAPQEPQPPAEKPSLLDGISAFFQRVAGRLDENETTDHSDDKE
jgi:hypothetical protein